MSPELPRAGQLEVREATAALWRRLDLELPEHGGTIEMPSSTNRVHVIA